MIKLSKEGCYEDEFIRAKKGCDSTLDCVAWNEDNSYIPTALTLELQN